MNGKAEARRGMKGFGMLNGACGDDASGRDYDADMDDESDDDDDDDDDFFGPSNGHSDGIHQPGLGSPSELPADLRNPSPFRFSFARALPFPAATPASRLKHRLSTDYDSHATSSAASSDAESVASGYDGSATPGKRKRGERGGARANRPKKKTMTENDRQWQKKQREAEEIKRRQEDLLRHLAEAAEEAERERKQAVQKAIDGLQQPNRRKQEELNRRDAIHNLTLKPEFVQPPPDILRLKHLDSAKPLPPLSTFDAQSLPHASTGWQGVYDRKKPVRVKPLKDFVPETPLDKQMHKVHQKLIQAGYRYIISDIE